VRNIKFEKGEKLIYEDKKVYLTNRNLVINHKRIFKKRIMLGDIRKWNIEKDKIRVSIMKKARLRELVLEVPLDKIEDIFKELEKSIKESKEIEYRKTTSWYWEDLVEEGEEIIEIFSKKSKPLIVFNLIMTIPFLFFVLIGILTGNLFKEFAFIISLVITIFYGGGLLNVKSKLIILNNSLIIKGVFISRKLYLKEIDLKGFIHDISTLIAIAPVPSRYFFKIKYEDKEFQYPTWITSGFPYKLGEKKYEKIVKLLKECEKRCMNII